MDLIVQLLRDRPDSKWSFYMATNIRWVVTRTNIPLGAPVTELPDYLMRDRSIVDMTSNLNTGRAYTDNLCLFRNVAYFKNRKDNLERLTKRLFAQYT